MKTRIVVLAAALLTAATSLAFAQSAPSPANQSGPDVSRTAPSPTDPAMGSETGNSKGVPARGTTSANPGGAGTTGSARPASPAKQSMDKDKSPASQNSGIKQEK
jgi:hypothetical protein